MSIDALQRVRKRLSELGVAWKFNDVTLRAVILAALSLTDEEEAHLGESTGLGAQNVSEVIGDLFVMFSEGARS